MVQICGALRKKLRGPTLLLVSGALPLCRAAYEQFCQLGAAYASPPHETSPAPGREALKPLSFKQLPPIESRAIAFLHLQQAEAQLTTREAAERAQAPLPKPAALSTSARSGSCRRCTRCSCFQTSQHPFPPQHGLSWQEMPVQPRGALSWMLCSFGAAS